MSDIITQAEIKGLLNLDMEIQRAVHAVRSRMIKGASVEAGGLHVKYEGADIAFSKPRTCGFYLAGLDVCIGSPESGFPGARSRSVQRIADQLRRKQTQGGRAA